MKLLKSITIIILVFMLSVVAIDVFIYFFFSDHVRRFSPKYKMSNDCEPVNELYMPHSERGFDIKPGIRDVLCYEPWEAPIYTAWGNSLGCFDTEKEKGYQPDIYLAGDSYTWGYAPFEDKFGTILENKTGRNVLKCGVTHTGQRHQFSKFLDVSERLGQFPEVVVVNYVSNDMESDYVYPHSTAINNQLIEDTYLKRGEDGFFEIVRLDEDALISTTKAKQERKKTSNNPYYYLFLRRYSASSNILNVVIKHFREYKKGSVQDDERLHHFYGLADILVDSDMQKGLPIQSVYGEENQKILLEWKKHSQENNYRLIISLIPYIKISNVNYYRNLEYFLSQNGIEHYNFEDYLAKRNIDLADIMWRYDAHLNIKGNAVYADYLEVILHK